MSSKVFLTAGIFLTIAVLFPAAAGDIEREPATVGTTVIDREQGFIDLTITAEIPAEGKSLPAESIRMERSIQQSLSRHLSEVIQILPVDSYRRGIDFIREDHELVSAISSTAAKGERKFPEISSDLKKMSITYRFYIYPDIAGLFPSHSRTSMVPETLDWSPSSDYSGIVIYAAEPLPVRGENDNRLLEPCFFPRLFGEDMEVAIESLMINPEKIKQEGMVMYSRSLDPRDWTDRVGFNPLRITAKEIFGKNYTDIILFRRDLNKILYREKNRRLISSGKILIILHPEKAVQKKQL
ncbi:MAG: hypothetical protein ACLFSE_12915 [Spirochaetia bacterium]